MQWESVVRILIVSKYIQYLAHVCVCGCVCVLPSYVRDGIHVIR